MLSSLANCVANSIPCLARASFTTISWMCSYLHLAEDTEFSSMAFSILTPHLLQSLSYDNDVEERVLASYSLLHLTKNSGISFISLLTMWSLYETDTYVIQ